jgi:hypothetical protein
MLARVKQAVFADLQAALAAATQVGADVLITADPNNTLTQSAVLSTLHGRRLPVRRVSSGGGSLALPSCASRLSKGHQLEQ